MKQMTEYEGVRTMRGIIFGLLLACGIFWLPLAAVILAVVFAPHALLAPAHVEPADPLFGPVSRLLFSVLMLLALTKWAARQRLPGRATLAVAVSGLAASLLIVAGLHVIPVSVLTPLQARFLGRKLDLIAVAIDALVLLVLLGQWRLRRRPLQLAIAAAVACLGAGSLLLLTSTFWQLRW